MTDYNESASPGLGLRGRPLMDPLNKFRHADVGDELSKAEWLSISGHSLPGGVSGDHIVLDAAGHLSRRSGSVQKELASTILTTDFYSAGYEIQEAIDALPANGGTIYLGKGTFTLPKALIAKSYLRIIGQGMYATTLSIQSSGENGIEVVGEGSGGSQRKNAVIIEGLTIAGSVSSGAGLYAKFNFGPNVCRSVRFRNCGTYGVQLDNNGSSWIFDRCRFDENTKAGVRLMVSTNPESFYDCIWSGNVEEGLLIDGDTNEIIIAGGNFNANGKQAIALKQVVRTIVITGVHFEYNGTAMLTSDEDNSHILIGTDSLAPYNIKVDTCWFNGEKADLTSHTRNGVRLTNGSSILVMNCAFRKLVSACYRIESGKTLTHLFSTIVDNVPATSSGGTLQAIQVA